MSETSKTEHTQCNNTNQLQSLQPIITNQQVEQLIQLTMETNALVKQLVAQLTPSARKKICVEKNNNANSKLTSSLQCNKISSDNTFLDTDIAKSVVDYNSLPVEEKKTQPIPLHNKSKKVLHVLDSDNTVLEVVDPVGFLTLEHIVGGSKSVSLFVPSPTNWFRQYVERASPMHEPADMSDCMIQIMTRLLHYYTTSSSVFVVPFAVIIEQNMTREDICLLFQRHSFMLSDMKKLCSKNHCVAVVVMDGDFGVILYHVGHNNEVITYPTLTMICSDSKSGRKYCVAGVADYFAILMGLGDKMFRTTYTVHNFDDCCGDIDAYIPWSFKHFQSSNAPFFSGSHMMTIKLVLSFVSSIYTENEELNALNNDLVNWKKAQQCKDPGIAFRVHISKICYDMMVYAIKNELYRPIRDEVGRWCKHLDPIDICQTVTIMVVQLMNNIKGMF